MSVRARLHGVAGRAIGVVSAGAELDRRIVRETAERRFGVDRMVDEYLAVYERILQRAPMVAA